MADLQTILTGLTGGFTTGFQPYLDQKQQEREALARQQQAMDLFTFQRNILSQEDAAAEGLADVRQQRQTQQETYGDLLSDLISEAVKTGNQDLATQLMGLAGGSDLGQLAPAVGQLSSGVAAKKAADLASFEASLAEAGIPEQERSTFTMLYAVDPKEATMAIRQRLQAQAIAERMASGDSRRWARSAAGRSGLSPAAVDDILGRHVTDLTQRADELKRQIATFEGSGEQLRMLVGEGGKDRSDAYLASLEEELGSLTPERIEFMARQQTDSTVKYVTGLASGRVEAEPPVNVQAAVAAIQGGQTTLQDVADRIVERLGSQEAQRWITQIQALLGGG